jgi:hypothetical protein
MQIGDDLRPDFLVVPLASYAMLALVRRSVDFLPPAWMRQLHLRHAGPTLQEPIAARGLLAVRPICARDSMAKPAGSTPFRRSARVQVRIPVTLSGTLPDGKAFSEETYITSVSKYGGRIKSGSPVTVGVEVKVQPRLKREAGLFRVVWVGREGTSRAGEIGLEYVDLLSLFGVTFPE